MKEELQNIIRAPLEDVMHDSFMPYAEYVILERAIPRVEDGLKPVQRHILFAMHEMQILPTGSHKKCARIVGETMGKYHPHGDSSIYEALARMAQDFSMSAPLIDGQGNFGSIDGDGPAAMRYTEARLAPIALELLRDLDKDTVPFQLNFDDTLKEPSVLPSRFPNLLVNGATGIAVGLATNIPPHNLREVTNGVCYRMEHPDCSLESVMRYVKGPDFPTGGILLPGDGIREAYATGRGKVSLRAKISIEKGRSGKTLLVVTELPYEIRESAMLRKIEQLRTTRRELFSGISDVRSETDRSGIRAVIELKNGVNAQKVLDCLYKYSDLQISYGINMVAIANGQPKVMNLLQIMDAYIAHQRSVVTNRLNYDKEAAEEKAHKLEGLIKAVLDIDRVISIVRSSESAKDARLRLMRELKVTGVQAQAILDLRLARLTKLEVITLEREYDELSRQLAEIQAILASPERLNALIAKEMGQIASKHGCPRRTPISRESGEITIDEDHFKVVEDCTVLLTRGGNLKRMSKKAFSRGAEAGDPEFKNQPAKILEVDSEAKLWAFTNLGNLYMLAAGDIKEARYRDAGSPIGTLLPGLSKGERVLELCPPILQGELLFVTAGGKVKVVSAGEFQAKKSKIAACGLAEGDQLIAVSPVDPARPNLLLVSEGGMSICFARESIPLQGRTAKGVGGITLAKDDSLRFAFQTDAQGSLVCFSEEGYVKQTALSDFLLQNRNGKGSRCFSWQKDASNGTHLVAAFYLRAASTFEAWTELDLPYHLPSSQISFEERGGFGQKRIPNLLGDPITQVIEL